VGVLLSLEGKTMTLGKFTLATCLLTAPAWAQYSKTDMTKLAMDRLDTAAHALKLSPDQVAGIKPLLETKCVYMGQIKDVYRASPKDSASKKTAQDSLKAVHAKYDAQISAILNPEQAKEWKRLQKKDWKDDLTVPKS
jgi:hypothetical protein